MGKSYYYYQDRLIEGTMTAEEAKVFIKMISEYDPYRHERIREMKRIIREEENKDEPTLP